MTMNTDAGKRSIGQRWEAYQPSKSAMMGAFVVGALAATIAGFGWGGWVTGGTARALVAEASKTTHAELASAVCVERFNAAADSAARLTELSALDTTFARRQFVEAGGWATMPGKTAPDRNGAEGCAATLIKS